MHLTVEQILALAPDAASAKAGSGQASRSKWSGLGGDGSALWGLCQGSGKDPYRAQIDLAGPAFKCTCPSRKFPCKHGLGLYLLHAKEAGAFSETAQPAWVSDWFKGREERNEKKQAKLAAPDESPEDRAAKAKGQLKRQEKREGNVETGLAVLALWQADLARDGLSGLRGKPAAQWEKMAARLVDMQAPGLASRVRRAGALIYSSSASGWEPQVARELGQLALLAESYHRLPQLPAALANDVRIAIGWPVSNEEVLATPGIHDSWDVLGSYQDDDGRIARRACYFRARESGRWAMVLQFAAGNQALPPPYLPGMCHQGSMHFYPGAVPLRALPGADFQVMAAGAAERSPETTAELLYGYAAALGANPFLDRYPMLLENATPVLHDDRTVITTKDGFALPVDPAFTRHWHLQALAGAYPVSLFGLWNGTELLPLSVRAGGALHALERERT